MINFELLELLYAFTIFAILFFCFSKILVNNFKTSISINNNSNRITKDYKISNNLTVYDYEAYNHFLIWLFVTES